MDFIPFGDDTDEEEKDVVMPLDLPKTGRRGNLGLGRQPAPKPKKKETDQVSKKRYEELIIAGGFPETKIYLSTSQNQGAFKTKKWTDSNMAGTLEIAQLGKKDNNMAQLRLVAIDKIGVRRGILMEYEFALNFVFKPNQTKLFSSVQIMQGEHMGFLFKCDRDRIAFDSCVTDLQQHNKRTKAQIQGIKLRATKQSEQEIADELGEAIDAEVLFNGQDEDKKAQELFKLLSAAGMDVTEDLSDGLLTESIMNVLQNFDPNKKLTEEDSSFTTQMLKYQHQAKKNVLRERRRGKELEKTDESYLTGLSENVAPTLNLEERRAQQTINTAYLKKHIDEIKRQNNVERNKSQIPLLKVSSGVGMRSEKSQKLDTASPFEIEETKTPMAKNSDRITGPGFVVDLIQPYYSSFKVVDNFIKAKDPPVRKIVQAIAPVTPTQGQTLGEKSSMFGGLQKQKSAQPPSTKPLKKAVNGPTGRPCYPPPPPKLNGPRPNPGGTRANKLNKNKSMEPAPGSTSDDLIRRKGPTGRVCFAPQPPKIVGPRPNPPGVKDIKLDEDGNPLKKYKAGMTEQKAAGVTPKPAATTAAPAGMPLSMEEQLQRRAEEMKNKQPRQIRRGTIKQQLDARVKAQANMSQLSFQEQLQANANNLKPVVSALSRPPVEDTRDAARRSSLGSTVAPSTTSSVKQDRNAVLAALAARVKNAMETHNKQKSKRTTGGSSSSEEESDSDSSVYSSSDAGSN